MIKRVTHKHIERAVQALNARRGLSYPSHGYLQYADIRGDGVYRPGFWVMHRTHASDASGGAYNYGLNNVSSLYRGRTMRETLDKVNSAS